jgi:DNA polymerase II large subunit
MAEYSEKMERYFNELEAEAGRCYSIAEKARSRYRDPSPHVEIPRAKDLAERVEKLLVQQGFPVEGVAEEIRELSKTMGNREMVAIEMAKRTAKRLREGEDIEKAIDTSIRLGLAVMTEGILVAPLEGIVGVKLRKNDDGSDYLSIFFAGPIRSAGGTGQALSVLIGDVVRREFGIDRYKPR